MNRLINVDVLHVVGNRVANRCRIHRLERVRLHEDVVGLAVLKVDRAT